MNPSGGYDAWLESAKGERFGIRGTCSIGRKSSNQIVLPDGRVSRLHALVQVQDGNECWLVDFGSTNGTSLNGRRVTHPTALRDGDHVEIADVRLTFHRAASPNADDAFTPLEVTIKDIRSVPCWLLVADIESYSRLSQTLAPDELPVVTGRWLSQCKQAIDDHGGSINKFLGDGFLAYWRDRGEVAGQVAAALDALARVQAAAQPRFRVVVHHGMVSVGGGGSMGEESLLGKDLNFVFRMEKLAGSLRLPVMFSESACEKLKSLKPAIEVGRHSVSGFDGRFCFFEPTMAGGSP